MHGTFLVRVSSGFETEGQKESGETLRREERHVLPNQDQLTNGEAMRKLKKTVTNTYLLVGGLGGAELEQRAESSERATKRGGVVASLFFPLPP